MLVPWILACAFFFYFSVYFRASYCLRPFARLQATTTRRPLIPTVFKKRRGGTRGDAPQTALLQSVTDDVGALIWRRRGQADDPPCRLPTAVISPFASFFETQMRLMYAQPGRFDDEYDERFRSTWLTI